jgi:predicted MFS family arabinose efflux permease
MRATDYRHRKAEPEEAPGARVMLEAPQGARAARAPYGSAATQAYGIGLLVLVYVFAMLDRSMVAVLIQPIKAEFHLSDTQLGFVSSLGFSLAYTLTAFPFGYAVDRVRRVSLLAGALAVWSALTFVSGLMSSFVLLCIARIGVGLADGGQHPTVVSIAGDIVPARRRATALTIIHMGIPAGALVSFLLSGWIAHEYGWRSALLVAGGPGVLLALVIFLTMPEPAREHAARGEVEAPYGVARFFAMLRARPALPLMLLATCFASMNLSAVSVWTPAFLMRRFGLSLAQMSAGLAVSAGACGIIGAALAGPIADRFAKGSPAGTIRVTALLFLLLGPLTIAMVVAPSIGLALLFNGLLSAIVPAYLGCLYSSILGASASPARGLMIATVAIITNLVGYGVGPQVVGYLSDILPGASAYGPLRSAMICLGGATVGGALLMFYAAIVQRRRDAKFDLIDV